MILTSLNWKPLDSPEVSHKFPSVTIPDMAYSVDDLIQRHRAGLLTDADVGREAVWSEDADLDDVDMEKMMREDIDVKHEFAKEGREALSALRKKKGDADAKAAADAAEAAVQARIAAAVAAQGTPPTQ